MSRFPGQKETQTECLILGNGPSLEGRDWSQVPRDRVFVFGVNQSWRLVPTADAHCSIDYDQFQIPESKPYYEAMSKKGTLYHTRAGNPLGIELNRHDEIQWGRWPFRKRHRGHHNPAPPPEQDGGVALKTCHGPSGSSAYVALQIAAFHGFERYWAVGMDMGDTGKFTGQKSNSSKHDRLWCCVPKDVWERTWFILPSATEVMQKTEWPWGH